MNKYVKFGVIISIIFWGILFSQSDASAACQLVDVGSRVILNKPGVAPSFATYAEGETVTATVKTKTGFNCESYQVQFMFCPVNGSSADCSLRDSRKDKVVAIQNGSAAASWSAAQFNNFKSYRIKAAAGTDNPNVGSSWQYYSDRFDILSGGSCGITNFTAIQSGSQINFDVSANSSCEGKVVNIELLIQSPNLGTRSGGRVASGTIASGKFTGSWPFDTSLGVVYFKACIAGVSQCQTSTTSGTPPGGTGGGGGGGGGGTGPVTPGTSQPVIFKLENPIQATNFVELIDIIATWLFNIAIPVTVAMIIYAGVIFLISRGDTSKITQARQILLYAVIGFTIILVGKGFITLIESILNLGAGP